MSKNALLSLIFGFCTIAQAFAQLTHDSTITQNRKNIVRINLTPTLLFGFKNYVAGYERVFKGHNSVSVNVGYLTLPQVYKNGLEKYGVFVDRGNFGFSFVADYRRYFKKRNRGLAPDGLYFGPYLATYNYWNSNRITFDQNTVLKQTTVDLKSSLHVNPVGIQIGYQFIVKERLAVDLVLAGPGVGYYRFNGRIEGELDPAVEDEVLQDLIDAVIAAYPGAEDILGKQSFESKGSIDLFSAGYRLAVQVGFLF